MISAIPVDKRWLVGTGYILSKASWVKCFEQIFDMGIEIMGIVGNSDWLNAVEMHTESYHLCYLCLRHLDIMIRSSDP